MQMEVGLDTGPVRATTEIEINHQTTGHLTTQLAVLGAELMVAVLNNLSAHPAVAQPEEGVTYAAKIEKAEARLDFSAGSVPVERRVRAFNPMPGAWFEFEGERVRILNAAVLTAGPNDYNVSFSSQPGLVMDDQLTIGCGDGAIRPMTLQRAGRGMMDTLEFLRGFPIPPGTILK
jgi:methionyl-tRNA formyltransferase